MDAVICALPNTNVHVQIQLSIHPCKTNTPDSRIPFNACICCCFACSNLKPT